MTLKMGVLLLMTQCPQSRTLEKHPAFFTFGNTNRALEALKFRPVVERTHICVQAFRESFVQVGLLPVSESKTSPVVVMAKVPKKFWHVRGAEERLLDNDGILVGKRR
ncbi:hypothetical protein F5148DRAFT_1183405 [Russula earlei]|uniref:Uncharacterized protein n=1 Tax=Russula earlei TaxID=71964 RepID=A0ACC0UEL7_9AGAM|nr:hypothetical protein F5148DRAFT_1183405 [Russula earlei]